MNTLFFCLFLLVCGFALCVWTMREAEKSELNALELLFHKGPQFGLELVAASRGKLPSGLVYWVLYRMEVRKLVIRKEEPGADPITGISRSIYTITAHGEAEMDHRLAAAQI